MILYFSVYKRYCDIDRDAVTANRGISLPMQRIMELPELKVNILKK